MWTLRLEWLPDGTPYDRVQRNIRYNHVALGPRGWGRMGPRVRLRVDGAAYLVDATQLTEDTEEQVQTITIRKREFKLDAEGVVAAQQTVNEETKKADADAGLWASQRRIGASARQDQRNSKLLWAAWSLRTKCKPRSRRSTACA